MKISRDGVEIAQRFFYALNLLCQNKTIRGVQTFTNAHGINRPNFLRVMANMNTSALKPEWIKWLCNDYGISCEWIIFGRGKMLK